MLCTPLYHGEVGACIMTLGYLRFHELLYDTAASASFPSIVSYVHTKHKNDGASMQSTSRKLPPSMHARMAFYGRKEQKFSEIHTEQGQREESIKN